MKDSQRVFPQDFYKTHLTTINGIHFTRSEIDVVSCVCNIMILRAKKIASFLLIETSTFYRHVANIMGKIGCHSQEAIIEFMRKAGVQSALIEHYSLLKMERSFEKFLKEKISKMVQTKDTLECFLQTREKNDFASRIQNHLRLSGLPVYVGTRLKEGDNILFVLSNSQDEESLFHQLQTLQQRSLKKKIFVLLHTKNKNKLIIQDIKDVEILDFSSDQEYYLTFIILLTKLLPSLDLEKNKSDLQNYWAKAPPSLFAMPSSFNNHRKIVFISDGFIKLAFLIPILKQLKHHKTGNISLRVVYAMALIGVGFFVFSGHQAENQDLIKPNFILPKDEALLSRPEFLKQIEDKFKEGEKDKDSIQIVALVGQGGAGKTTLARQYAQQQKSVFFWEINAETTTSLQISFESLAQNLVKTDMDKKTLKRLSEIKMPLEQEEKIIQFVKERLVQQPRWCLIYDNVEKFADIQKYIPKDPNSWGNGKVIVTTRDGNIESNEHIHNTLFIGELTPQQKIILFTDIMKIESFPSITESQEEEMKGFLEKIPPFPLDVSIAAYYLKTTNASYQSYLENITLCDKDFIALEEDLLKDAGNYLKTRYSIITLSLQHIINIHKDFRDLLIFISLLDSQNISRELLNNFKSASIVDRFIFYLKKHSLLTSKTSSPLLSLHRSTQAIILRYLTQALDLKKNTGFINTIAEFFVESIDITIKEEDIHKMKTLTHSCERFLSHQDILTQEIEGIIKSKLGAIYFFVGSDIKAKTSLEESLIKLKSLDHDNPMHLAFTLGYLGNVERDMGNYTRAKLLLEQSLSIYNQHPKKDPVRHAYFFVYLSIVETYLGNYKTAENLLKKGLLIQKRYFPENKNYVAWVSGRRGILERIFGNYEKAEILLEKALITFQKGQSALDVAWVLQHLGVVYAKRGKYEKAKQALIESLNFWVSLFPDEIGPLWVSTLISTQDIPEQANYLYNKLLNMYTSHFHETYIEVAWHLGQLGLLYRDLGNYEKAQIFLEYHKAIVEKNLGQDHVGVSVILNNLGDVHLLQGNLKSAKNLMYKACAILEKQQHPNQYQCLETLAKLYVRKSFLALEQGKKETSQKFQQKAISYLRRALNVVKKYFSCNSVHAKRIQESIYAMDASCRHTCKKHT